MAEIIVASAPTKVILAGEHAAVYGATALAAPISPRNCIFLERRAGKPGLVLENPAAPRWRATLGGDGAFSGNPACRGFLLMASRILREEGTGIAEQGAIRARLEFSGSPKGTGNSASIAAALAIALFTHLGKTPARDKVFRAVQVAEKEVHGISTYLDAWTVLSGSAQRFHKEWNKQGRMELFFEKVRAGLPRGTELLVIDTLRRGEAPQATAELLATFARHFFHKSADNVGGKERMAACHAFNPVIRQIEAQLKTEGDARALGECLDENHELLRRAGVSSPGIEEARKIALANGALGAKLTGSGGRGGAVIALAWEKDVPAIKQNLERKKMKADPAKFAKEGPRIEKRTEK